MQPDVPTRAAAVLLVGIVHGCYLSGVLLAIAPVVFLLRAMWGLIFNRDKSQ